MENSRLIQLSFLCRGSPTPLLQGLSQWQTLGLLDDGDHSLTLRVKQAVEPSLDLTLTSQTQTAMALQGLRGWYDLGLLNDAEIHGTVELNAAHPALLAGLDAWLELNLLQSSHVKKICLVYLTCEIPLPVLAPEISTVDDRPVISPPLPAVKSMPEPVAPAPSRLRQMAQSLMDELSVLWLLLLGVFMVVVSSGVLAASQWQRFPSTGQYAILWIYTLGFGAASYWASRQPYLRLTSQALRIVTLLLVPINFLAMDSFALWRSPLGWLVMAIAAGSLSVLSLYFLHSTPRKPGWIGLSLLGLSVLQWGWTSYGYALGAIYVGVIGTAAITLYGSQPKSSPQDSEDPAGLAHPFSLNGALLVYALGILLARAIFVAAVPMTELALAIAICGALVAWQYFYGVRYQALVKGDTWGGGLILLGWLLSAGTIPGQAVIISGLGLWFWGERVARYRLGSDLVLFWLTGLQLFWLTWRCLPDGAQNFFVSLGRSLSGEDTPAWTLLSLALFPYLLFSVWLWRRLRRTNDSELLITSQGLALLLGITLTALSLGNPVLRSLNFAGSTLILGFVTLTEANIAPAVDLPKTRGLATWTHLAGLLTMIAVIDGQWPRLDLGTWTLILLGLMGMETYGGLLSLPRKWALFWSKQHFFNLGLAVIAYGVLAVNQDFFQDQMMTVGGHSVVNPSWSLVWGLVPLVLTSTIFLAGVDRSRAANLAIASSLVWQSLTLPIPLLRPWGLGVASLCVLVSTVYSSSLATALIAVGFLLGTSLSLLLLVLPPLTSGSGLILASMTVIALWGWRHYLIQRPSSLARYYAQACDLWALGIYGATLFFLWGDATFLIIQNPRSMTAIAILMMSASFYRSRQPPVSPVIAWLSIINFIFISLVLLPLPGARLLGLGLGLALLIIQTHYLEQEESALVTVGFALAFVATAVWEQFPQWTPDSGAGWLLLAAIAVLSLWLCRWALLPRQTALARLYRSALNSWGVVLCGLTLTGLTLHGFFVYNKVLPASISGTVAAGVILVAIAFRSWPSLNNRTLYSLAWGLELLAVESLGLGGGSLLTLAVINILLGLMTQLLGDWWHRRSQTEIYLNGWHGIPLLYGAIGASLRWGLWEHWTGLTTLGLVVISVGVGRRRQDFKPLLYLALIGISLSAYEVLFYQIAPLSLGEQVLAMATLATTILYGYRLFAPWLSPYLGVTPQELNWAAHLHWFLGSGLLLLTAFIPAETDPWLGLGTGLFLIRYALWQGRYAQDTAQGELWVYLGLGEATMIALDQLPRLNSLPFLDPYLGFLSSMVAIAIYLSPWSQWGWSPRPWQNLAITLPLAGLVPNVEGFYPLNFLAIAGFYGGLAYLQRAIRWTYVSLILLNGLAVATLHHFSWQSPLAYGVLLGMSLFYLAAYDPACQITEGRDLRHVLRLIGIGVISVLSLRFYAQPGFIPGIWGISLIFAGLSLRIRAFLYGGTLTFLAIAGYQSLVLILEAPILKWIIGLLLGLGFIWIAATFETRREQFSVWLRNWLMDFETWD